MLCVFAYYIIWNFTPLHHYNYSTLHWVVLFTQWLYLKFAMWCWYDTTFSCIAQQLESVRLWPKVHQFTVGTCWGGRNYAYFGVQYLHHNDKTIHLYFAHLLHRSKQQLLFQGAKKVNVYVIVMFFVIDDEKWNMHCDFFRPVQVIGWRVKIVLIEGGGSGTAAVLGPGIRPCPDPARIFNIFHFIKIFSFTLWIISRTKAMKHQHPVAQQKIFRMRS